MVFHTPVVEDIGADLRSPLDLLLRSLERLLRGHAFIQFPLVELRTEDAHGILAVHQLRTGFHILDQELHRLARIGVLAVVAQAHGCLDLVDILPPSAARTERIPLDVRRVDRNLDRIVHGRRHEHRGESRLAFVIGIERREAHHTVHAVFALEVPVGILALELQRTGFHAHLVAGLVVEHLDLVTVRLAPSGIHAQEHRRPIERLGTPGSGVDVHDRPQFVLFAAQHVAHFERLDTLERLCVMVVHLRLAHDPFLHEIGHQPQVFDILGHGIVVVDPRLDGGDTLRSCSRALSGASQKSGSWVFSSSLRRSMRFWSMPRHRSKASRRCSNSFI